MSSISTIHTLVPNASIPLGYYDEDNIDHFLEWYWVTTNNDDTTVGDSDCSYDRIILNDGVSFEYVDDGIYKERITKEVSDHYLVWVEIVTEDI